MRKKEFPIFDHNPDLIYLDSAASTQKPRFVIEGVNNFITHDYANIHRGIYPLSERSEEHYHLAKERVAQHINCKPTEIFFTYNTTYGINLIAQSLCISGKLQKGDTVLLSRAEHHANILPRQILQKQYGFTIDFFGLDEDTNFDEKDFLATFSGSVKIVSVSLISNVTGTIHSLEKIKKNLHPDTILIVDASQGVGHIPVDMQKIGADVLIFTGHKMMAYTGIGIVCIKSHLAKELETPFGGGGIIEFVDTKSHIIKRGIEKFEPGTPNIIGAVSLAKGIEFIENIGYDAIVEHEKKLMKSFLEQIKKFPMFEIIGSHNIDHRTGIFSLKSNYGTVSIAEYMASKNISIRCGGHCAHPLFESIAHQHGACRISLYLYNSLEDIDIFFVELKNFLSLKK